MDKDNVIQTIGDSRVLPVVRTGSGDEAKTVVDAVVTGGCKIVEITLTIPGAIGLIREIADLFPEVIVGAGTVSSADEARDCVAAGAGFIVSPWIEAEVIKFCNTAGVLVIPGALTPTEVWTARSLGAQIVKVFPIVATGGVSYIRALRSVLPGAMLIPTGGVTVDNAAEFIEAGAFAVGIGSDLLSVEELRQDDGTSAVSRVTSLLTKIKQCGAIPRTAS